MPQNLFRLVHRLETEAGVVEPGATIACYLAGTMTAVTLFSDRQLTVTAGSSVTASASGVVPERWIPDGVVVKLVYADPEGAVRYTRDYFNQQLVGGQVTAPTKADLKALIAPAAGIYYQMLRRQAGQEGGGGFDWSDADLSAEVAQDTQEGVYIAPAGQNGEGGAFVRRIEGNWLNLEVFGLVQGDHGTSEEQAARAHANNVAVQSYLDAPLLSNRWSGRAPDRGVPCLFKRNLVFGSEQRVDFCFPDGITTGAGEQYDGYCAFRMGPSFKPNNRPAEVVHALHAATPFVKGGRWLKLATPAHAADYQEGDCVTLESTDEYDTTAELIAMCCQPNVVESVVGDMVYVRLGADMLPATGYVLRRMSRLSQVVKFADGVTADGTRTIAFIRDTHVTFRKWTCQVEAAPLVGGGGAITCTAHGTAIEASRGVAYGNAWANCHFSAQQQTVTRGVSELAYGCWGSRVDFGITTVKAGVTPAWLVGWTEGARRNHMTGKVTFETADIGLYFENSSDNTYDIELVGDALTYDAFREMHVAYSGDPPECSRNHGRIKSTVRTQAQYLYSEGGAMCAENIVEHEFRGAVSSTISIYDNGASRSLYIGFCEHGFDSVPASAHVISTDPQAAAKLPFRLKAAALAATGERDGRVVWVPDNTAGARPAVYISGVPYTFKLDSVVA